MKESLRTYLESYESLKKQNDLNEKEVSKLICEKKNLEAALSSVEREHHQSSSDSQHEICALKKTIRSKEKEIYNLSTKFSNSQDTNANLKAEMSGLKKGKSKAEKEAKTFEQKVMKLESTKKKTQFVSTQTYPTIDVPYSVTDSLPPIFASKMCFKTKPVFLAKSLPDLSQVSWVSRTEENMLREKADEALDFLYDREISTYYKEVYKETCELKGKEVTLNLDFGW